MATQITLGNFFTTTGGKTVLGGAGGSGLDTQSLINSLTQAKSAASTQDQDQIKINDAQSSALNTFASLLSTFQSASDALRNPPGVGNAANNVFQFTTGSVGNGGSAYLSVSTEPGAALQSYNISAISQLAAAATQGTGTFNITSADSSAVASSSTAGMFTAGTFTFNGANITLNAGDSLNTVAADFNAVSNTTGVAASVIQIASGQYQLSFVATKTGTSGSFDLTTATDPGGVLTNIGLTAAVAGKDALFKVNGVAIDRQTNNVSDVINGVTFNLLQTTPDNTTLYPVTVAPDTTTVQNSIVNFVNAYNAIKTFGAQQTQLNSDGTYASTAVLATNQTFRSIMASLTTQVTSEVTGLASGQPSSISDVGITLTNDPPTSTTPEVTNILTVNDGLLSSELATNFQGVASMFGFNLTSDNTNLKVFSETNGLNVSSFTLNIDPTNNIFTATYNEGNGPVAVPLTATAITGVSAYTLTGQSGTALDGLEMIYGSNAAATINVTTTNGIASQLYNTSNAATTANTGTLAVELQSLKDSDTRLNTDIANVTAQVNQYQQQLLSEFAALEQAISHSNLLLASLSANSAAALVQANLP